MPTDASSEPERFRCIAVLDVRTEDSLEQNQASWRAADPFAGLTGGGVWRYVRAMSRRTDKSAYRPRTQIGAAQFWVEGLDAALDLARKLKGRELVRDHPLLRGAQAMVLVTRERAVIPAPPGAEGSLRGLFFVKRKPGMSIADYQAYWLNVHGRMVIGTPGITRYIQCHVCPEAYEALQPPYDGMAEMSWSDEAGHAAFEASPQARIEQAGDLPNLFDLKAGFRFFVSEDVVF